MLGRVVEHQRRKALRLEIPPPHAVLLLEIDVHSWLHRWRAPCSQTPNHSINGRSESHGLPPTHNYSLRPAPIHRATDPRQSALGARRSGCRSLRLAGGDCRPCEPDRCERVPAAWTALQAKRKLMEDRGREMQSKIKNGGTPLASWIGIAQPDATNDSSPSSPVRSTRESRPTLPW